MALRFDEQAMFEAAPSRGPPSWTPPRADEFSPSDAFEIKTLWRRCCIGSPARLFIITYSRRSTVLISGIVIDCRCCLRGAAKSDSILWLPPGRMGCRSLKRQQWAVKIKVGQSQYLRWRHTDLSGAIWVLTEKKKIQDRWQNWASAKATFSTSSAWFWWCWPNFWSLLTRWIGRGGGCQPFWAHFLKADRKLSSLAKWFPTFIEPRHIFSKFEKTAFCQSTHFKHNFSNISIRLSFSHTRRALKNHKNIYLHSIEARVAHFLSNECFLKPVLFFPKKI